MNHAVILSSFVPATEVAIKVAGYFLDTMRLYFSDCTIYVGINTGSSDAWREMLDQSGLDIVVCEVPAHLSVDSDVAGFQAVLRTLRATRARHDYYWFGHTKGVSHERYEDAELLRSILERDFWSRRAEVEANCDPQRHGAFPAFPMPAAGPNTEVVSYLRSIFPSHCQPIGYVATYTFFGLTGVSLRNFLASADERFFEQNLTVGTGVSRYFFEGGFSWIADMAGFEPYLLQKEYKLSSSDPVLREPCRANEFEQNQQRVAGMIKKWRSDRKNYSFQGWPTWAGSQVQLSQEFYTAEEFFRRPQNHLASFVNDIDE